MYTLASAWMRKPPKESKKHEYRKLGWAAWRTGCVDLPRVYAAAAREVLEAGQSGNRAIGQSGTSRGIGIAGHRGVGSYMTASGWIQIIVFSAIVLLITKPLGI